jgi:hypothetical protein
MAPKTVWAKHKVALDTATVEKISAVCSDCVQTRLISVKLVSALQRYGCTPARHEMHADSAAFQASLAVEDMNLDQLLQAAETAGTLLLTLMGHMLRCAVQSSFVKLLEEFVALDPAHLHAILDFKVRLNSTSCATIADIQLLPLLLL